MCVKVFYLIISNVLSLSLYRYCLSIVCSILSTYTYVVSGLICGYVPGSLGSLGGGKVEVEADGVWIVDALDCVLDLEAGGWETHLTAAGVVVLLERSLHRKLPSGPQPHPLLLYNNREGKNKERVKGQDDWGWRLTYSKSTGGISTVNVSLRFPFFSFVSMRLLNISIAPN